MNMIMKPERAVGIVGYGAYIPRYRLPGSEVARVWTGDASGAVPVRAKSVPAPDEDVVTMSVEAGRNALARAALAPDEIRAVWVGSESHPYAVKPTGTLVAEALGISPATLAADLEFACKAGTEAMQSATALVGSGMADYAMAIGMDTAQARPGDALEYTAAAGGGAYIMGPGDEALARFVGSYSHVTDTPDFWRRAYAHYPSHGSRFTGEPAFFAHTDAAARGLLDGLGVEPAQIRHAVFHQPNAKFPTKAARSLGFSSDQIEAGLISPEIGNCYAGASPLGLTRALDRSAPGDLILIVSFGSGAGSDAMLYQVSDRIETARRRAPSTDHYLAREIPIDYATYARWRGKLQ